MNTSYTLIETVKNATNYTNEEFLPEYSKAINLYFRINPVVTQFIIMISMGSIITLEEIINHLKKPISVIIALVSQFFALPLCSFGIIILFQLTPEASLTALILACCPGGSVSNLFTYYCDGDVPLSTTLTTISTSLALGFMPLNLWIYARKWTDNQTLSIPYVGIIITLVLILVPLITGMLIKKYLPKTALIISKISSVIGMLLVVIFFLLQNIYNSKSFDLSMWKSWIVAGAISTGGFFAGLFMSLISKRPYTHVKTIAIETGMQNVALALTVVVTSFPQNLHGKMTPIPTMNSGFIVVVGVLLAVLEKIRQRCAKKNVYTIPKEQLVSEITI